jgi:iron(III) transport system substrate-binding protein
MNPNLQPAAIVHSRGMLVRGFFFIVLLWSGYVGAQPALYEGPDRSQRLIEGARREGSVNVYSSMVDKDLRRLAGEFEKKYGIKVNIWRSGKNKVLQRVLTEAQAGRFEADVVHNPAPEMEALYREKLLQEVRSPVQKELIPAAMPPHRTWAGARVYIFVQAYNTNRVKREELPRTYSDLLDPRWKGRLGIEGKEQEWFYTLVQEMGEAKGLAFFRQLVATNGLSVRHGNALLNNMVIAGEVPLALTLYSYLPEQSKMAGAPIDWFTLTPTIAYTDGIGVTKKAQHPHAAVLFYDYMLGEGQRLMAQMNHVVTSQRLNAIPGQFQLKFIDVGAVLDDTERWSRIFEDTINGRAAALPAARLTAG